MNGAIWEEQETAGWKDTNSRSDHAPHRDSGTSAVWWPIASSGLRGLVGRENVIAGSDCGFAQSDVIQRVHPTVMWAKFEALVEGARIASAELWQKGKSAQPS